MRNQDYPVFKVGDKVRCTTLYGQCGYGVGPRADFTVYYGEIATVTAVQENDSYWIGVNGSDTVMIADAFELIQE